MATVTAGCALLVALTGVTAFVPQGLTTSAPQAVAAGLQKEHTSAPSCRPMRMSLDDVSESRKGFLQGSAGVVAGAVAVGASTGASLPAEAASVSAWEQIQLPVASVLYDIAFDPEHPDHGLVVGAQGTFLEASMPMAIDTFDGGNKWSVRTFGNLDEEEEINYRFQKVSMYNDEIFIIGKPPILLHSKDAGKSWERVPLSPKLPGEPSNIVALGGAKAEMTTSSGAIYYTKNAGMNWSAQVKETVDATLNRISSSGVSGASYFTGSIIGTTRAEDGSYLAVSSRGNFYLTWSPGQDFWIPHNRGTSRRIQNMGFVRDRAAEGLWMTLNGGAMQMSTTLPEGTNDPVFSDTAIKSGGYGIIDVAWKNDNEAWAVGGGGSLWYSTDGGQTFKFSSGATNIGANLYDVKFFGGDKGFAIGSDGVLLKYIPNQL
ncbi:unnamed protein product [Scytosiphon promiscuus]